MGAGASAAAHDGPTFDDVGKWSKEEVGEQVAAIGPAFEKYKDIVVANEDQSVTINCPGSPPVTIQQGRDGEPGADGQDGCQGHSAENADIELHTDRVGDAAAPRQFPGQKHIKGKQEGRHNRQKCGVPKDLLARPDHQKRARKTDEDGTNPPPTYRLTEENNGQDRKD